MKQSILSPYNNFFQIVQLEDVSLVDGSKQPVVSGNVDGFIGKELSPTAEAAHANLNATNVVHIGGLGTYPLGTWLVYIDGETLTPDFLEPLFALQPNTSTSPPNPVLYVVSDSGVRAARVLQYASNRLATIV